MPSNTAELNIGFGTPFELQINFLRNKLQLPTERWDDIQRSAHDRAFIVAGAAKADLLNDLHQAVIQAAASGKGEREFQKSFKSIVAKHGWSGWTGEGTPEGEAWRARIIYQTNMATSYAAGRWQQMTEPDYLRLRPYWRYVHNDSVIHPRPLHLSWNGLTLLHDHPFWKTHFAPNGWGCECRIISVSKKDGLASAQAGMGSPPEGWDQIDPKTGAPVGIDKGFDYAPGASVKRSFSDLISSKLINLDAPIGAAMWKSLGSALASERLNSWHTLVDGTAQSMKSTNSAQQVHTVEPEVVSLLSDRGITLENAAIWMRDTELLHAIRDSKTDRGTALSTEFWRELPTKMENASAYIDTINNNLIYALPLDGKSAKVVVRVNFGERVRLDGVRDRMVSNFVRTGSVVNEVDLNSGSQYVLLLKK